MEQTTRLNEATPTSICVEGMSIDFGSFRAVQNIDLEVYAGEFLCLLGPSGCGKSTLLSAMAGFLEPSIGVLSGQDAPTGRRPNQNVGVVFQHSSVLFDWLTVRENIMFGPRSRGMKKRERLELANEYLKLVGLTDAGDRFPRQLSGGMRQRAQIARVLANRPDLVLMDEPFGALDAQTREVMQNELEKIWSSQQATVVFVTHDIEEAVLLADRVAIMTAGPAAEIKSVHSIDLPRPRGRLDAEFIEIAKVLREDISVEVQKTMATQGLEG